VINYVTKNIAKLIVKKFELSIMPKSYKVLSQERINFLIVVEVVGDFKSS